MSPARIDCQRDGDIATVVLDHPERLNALNLDMWRGLGQVFTQLAAEPALRCIVLRGAGERAFSAGADIAEFDSVRGSSAQSRAYSAVTRVALQAIEACPVPVIAQIHGPCVGGGLEVASLCDLRICGASSTFGVPIKRLGLVVSYEELSGLLALVGKARTLEILLEGRVFDADEALRMGLVNRVVPDDQVATEAAACVRRIASGAPLVARWHKRFVHKLMAGGPLSDADRDEAHHCFDTEDFQIGRRAFLDKRTPDFVGR